MKEVNYSLAADALKEDSLRRRPAAWTIGTMPLKTAVSLCIEKPYNINGCLMWSAATEVIKFSGSHWEREWFASYSEGKGSPEVFKLLNTMMFGRKKILLSDYM